MYILYTVKFVHIFYLPVMCLITLCSTNCLVSEVVTGRTCVAWLDDLCSIIPAVWHYIRALFECCTSCSVFDTFRSTLLYQFSFMFVAQQQFIMVFVCGDCHYCHGQCELGSIFYVEFTKCPHNCCEDIIQIMTACHSNTWCDVTCHATLSMSINHQCSNADTCVILPTLRHHVIWQCTKIRHRVKVDVLEISTV